MSVTKKILIITSLASLSLLSFKLKKDNPVDEAAYKKEISEWQQKRDADLKGGSSPLNLISIFWLKEGENTFGSGAKNDLVFPKGTLPEYAGKYIVRNDSIYLKLAEGSKILSKGKTIVTKATIPSPDISTVASKDTSIVLEHGSLKWFVFISGGRLAVRVLDSKSENQLKFSGVQRYPVDKKWRVEARLQPADKGTTIPITTVKGNTNDRALAGILTFSLEGKEYKFEALDRGNLFIVFSDKTKDKGTYAFRFLQAQKPSADGIVILDFNKATNPNCAFSVHAPCPLPPAQNNLDVAIPAGEKKYELK